VFDVQQCTVLDPQDSAVKRDRQPSVWNFTDGTWSVCGCYTMFTDLKNNESKLHFDGRVTTAE
jgi:hypothetical protein